MADEVTANNQRRVLIGLLTHLRIVFGIQRLLGIAVESDRIAILKEVPLRCRRLLPVADGLQLGRVGVHLVGCRLWVIIDRERFVLTCLVRVIVHSKFNS